MADFGVFPVGRRGDPLGLIPQSRNGYGSGTRITAEDFPENMELEVVVIELDAEGRRLTLSRKALKDAEARHVPEGSLGESNPRSLGTFADLMKGQVRSDQTRQINVDHFPFLF